MVAVGTPSFVGTVGAECSWCHEVGFARTVLAHGNKWFGKRKEETVGDK